jgi:hypothetical protein
MSMADLYKQFPDVHPNIILKTDLVRLGIKIGKGASQRFQELDDIAWKGYHFFSYDRQDTRLFSDRVPMQLRLEDGCPVQLETDVNSPYLLDFVDNDFTITENGETIAKNVYFPHKPRWYGMKLEDGTPMEAICQGFGDRVIFIIFNHYCELWNTKDECLFCNINATLKDQKAGGESTVVRKTPEVISEVLATALSIDPLHQRFIIVSGGTILGTYKGQTELEFYCSRLTAMKEKLGAAPPLTLQIGAQTDENWKVIHDTGIVTSVEPNMEVWDRKLFEWICPGKNKFVGYDEWIRRTIKAVDIFGPLQVNPNFVLGVEMAKPYGFTDVSTAVKSIAEGWDFLMSHGVLPRHRFWFIEHGSALGDQTPPPLEYYIEAQKAYAELRQNHGIEMPYATQMGGFNAYVPSCQMDWEYYHGTGTLSKQKLEARGYRGIPAFEKTLS